MAISATYITLQRLVADQLGNRIDLLSALADSSLSDSPIKWAIQSAIAKWEREPFYFNEVYDTAFLNTVSGTETYTSATIAAVVNIARLHVTIASARYALVPRKWTYLQDIGQSVTVGKPTDFAYYASTVRLYPVPDGAYAVTWTGTKRLSALSADGDANAWTQDGFDLTRAEALLILATEVLHDPELAARMELAIYGNPATGRLGYLDMLRNETVRRNRLLEVRSARSLDGAQPSIRTQQG